ncbi:hypothetical protein GOV10_00455, partial [Candidatus Woesearchaeota archaeon]|nr:hypothetical protein [Candidatus Woesearchaeota archaeon]
EFVRHEPPYEEFFRIAGQYNKMQNFIIIGRGGAVTSFKAIFQALGQHKTTKKVHILDTNDPMYVNYLKRKCKKDDTLVIVISKSGMTTDVIEDFIALQEYQKLIITGDNKSPLKQMQEVHDLTYAEHPNIGGRFSAITASTLLPAALLFIDAQAIAHGMRAMYALCSPKRVIGENPALELAATLYLLEQDGYTDIFTPLYGHQFKGFNELITQLMHETVCKEGKGMNLQASPAPESQHHTNQRIFGGRNNLVIIPHASQSTNEDVKISVPYEYKDISIKDAKLGMLEGESLHHALLYEYDGVCEEALAKHIPLCTVTLDAITPHSVGELIAFWQYVSIYSALLRNVNPYDQPEVEASKIRSFEHRKSRTKH